MKELSAATELSEPVEIMIPCIYLQKRHSKLGVNE